MNSLSLLVNNRIDRDRRLTCLTVADNKLTLSASDRNHGIDRLDTCLKRGIYGFSLDNTVGNTLDLSEFIRKDRTFSIDRLS